MKVLQVKNLHKNVNGKNIINDLSFTVAKGEIVSLIEHDSSLFRMFSNIIRGKEIATSGSILLSEDPVSKENLTDLSIMSNDSGLYERLTVKEYLYFFSKMYDLEKERIGKVIKLTGLQDRKNITIKKLSSSFFKRVQFARSILHDPSLIILENPTLGIDLESRQLLRELIINLSNEGTAILNMTVSIEEARLLSDKIAKVANGKIVSWEDLEEEKSKEVVKTENSIKFSRIPARVEDKIIFFNPPELLYIESNEGKALLHTVNNQYSCPLILSDLEERLRMFGFYRAHRSYIVNLQRIREVIPWSRNSYSIILDDPNKTEIPLSRNNYKELKEFLGF